jgi:ABC-type lipoprotein export system ATPase subunit
MTQPRYRKIAVSASDVFCLYPVPNGTVAALRGLSLRVPAGERLVVHGPNGSGKTTLLRVLMGEQPSSAGEVEVAGVDLSGADEPTRADLRLKLLGVVEQHAARALRPELDVRDNVALQMRLAGVRRREARTRAEAALDRLHLADLSRRRPATLSGGEAQRVAVCAALAHGPAVVLADEPTGELDAESADSVYDLLGEAVRDFEATLILVTHDRRASRIADRVVRIRDGRLSEEWSPDAPHDETLVVDDRGWVRLPEPLRRASGAGEGVRAASEEGRIVLHGLGPIDSAAEAPPAPAASPLRIGSGGSEPVARLKAVRVAYGSRVVLDSYDLDVPPGELTVIRGRSGSGKSTILRILLGLADPDEGTVLLGGTELAQLDRTARADQRKAMVAVSGQGAALAEPLDVEENLALARTARGLEPDPAVVAETIEALGLHPLRGRAVRLLSGGERQRVAVARSLVVERPLVVLDEPTSQQDEVHAELVAAVLAGTAARGVAVLCATHDPVLVNAAGSVVTLD